MTNLTNLSLCYAAKITDIGISQLFNLRVLDLNFNTIITSEGISHLTALTALDITSSSKMAENSLMNLTNLTNLAELQLDGERFARQDMFSLIALAESALHK